MTKARTYGEKIYTYRDDVSHLIGRECIFCNNLQRIESKPEECIRGIVGGSVVDESTGNVFFFIKDEDWLASQFIREIIEKEASK